MLGAYVIAAFERNSALETRQYHLLGKKPWEIEEYSEQVGVLGDLYVGCNICPEAVARFCEPALSEGCQ